MRLIKFRAWDNVAKKMTYGTREQFDDMLGFRFNHFECEKPVYMQFTGLIDKDGKEIYEGDILEWNGIFDQAGFVVFNKNLCGFSIAWPTDAWPTDIYTFLKNGFHGARKLLSNDDYSEIIGNIYENPELLN